LPTALFRVIKEEGEPLSMKKIEADINRIRLESIPYQNLFNREKKIDTWAGIFIWLASILALISVFLPWAVQVLPTLVGSVLGIVNCIAVFVGVVLTWAADIFYRPAAEFERIGGFVDNGYETKILAKPVYHYYNNGVAEKGIKRLSANCFENCFFTDAVSKEMTSKILIQNLMFLLVFTGLAIYNFTADNISALFQVLASSVLLEKMMKHLYFRRCIHELAIRFQLLFSTQSPDGIDFAAHSIYLIMKYEKVLSYYNQSLDSKVFNKLNCKLTQEWEEMKLRYNIVESESLSD
jgi:hypothetical protein